MLQALKKRYFFLILLALAAILGGLCEGFFSGSAQEAEDQVVEEPRKEARLSCDSPSFSYGQIQEAQGLVEHVFPVRNTGQSPLLIMSCKGSCGCLILEWTPEPIAPGAAGFIKVSYNPAGASGTFMKTVEVLSNAANGVLQLQVRGEVVKD